jgi:hypothetical protein
MHTRDVVAEALRLRDEEGLGARQVAPESKAVTIYVS